MIFGWPGPDDRVMAELTSRQSPWAGGAVSHLSLYSLIVEPGTPLADAVSRGIVTVPDDDAAADLYELAMDVLGDAGWVHYEVANWARQATRCRPTTASTGATANTSESAPARMAGSGIGASMRHLLPATYIGAIEGGRVARVE